MAADKRMTRWEPGVDFGKLVSLFSSSKKDAKPQRHPQPNQPIQPNGSRPQPNKNPTGGLFASHYAAGSGSSSSGSNSSSNGGGRAGAGTPNGRNPMRQPEAFTSSNSGYHASITSDAGKKGKGVVGVGGRDGRSDPKPAGPSSRSPLSRNPFPPPEGQAGLGLHINTNANTGGRLINQDKGLSPAPASAKGKAREEPPSRAGDIARKPAPAFEPDSFWNRNKKDARVPVPEIRVSEPKVSLEREPVGRDQRAKVQPVAAPKLVEVPARGVVDDRRQGRDNNGRGRPGNDTGAPAHKASAPQPSPSYAPVENGQRTPNRSELAAQKSPLPKDSTKTAGTSEKVDYRLDTRTGRLVPVSGGSSQDSPSQQSQQKSSWNPFTQGHQKKNSNSQPVSNAAAEEQSRSNAKGKQKEASESRSENKQFGQTAGTPGSARTPTSLIMDQATPGRHEHPAAVSRFASQTQGQEPGRQNAPQPKSGGAPSQPQVGKDVTATQRYLEESRQNIDTRIQQRQPPSQAQKQPQNTTSRPTSPQDDRSLATKAESMLTRLLPSQQQRDPAPGARERTFTEHANAMQQKTTRDPPAPAVTATPSTDRIVPREVPIKQAAPKEEQKRAIPGFTLTPTATSTKVSSRGAEEERGFPSKQTGSKGQHARAVSISTQNAAKNMSSSGSNGLNVISQGFTEAKSSGQPLSASGHQKAFPAVESQRRAPVKEPNSKSAQSQMRSEEKQNRDAAGGQVPNGVSRNVGLDTSSSRGNTPTGSSRHDRQHSGGSSREEREQLRVEIPQNAKDPYQAFKAYSNDKQGASSRGLPGSTATRDVREAQTPKALRQETTAQDSPKPLSLGKQNALDQILRKERNSTQVFRADRGAPQKIDSPLDETKRYQAFSPVSAARPSTFGQTASGPSREAEVLGIGSQRSRRETPDKERNSPKQFPVEKKATPTPTDARTRQTEEHKVPDLLSPGSQQRSDRKIEVSQQSALSKLSRTRPDDVSKQPAPTQEKGREEATRDARHRQTDRRPGEIEKRSNVPEILLPQQQRSEKSVLAADEWGFLKSLQSRPDGVGKHNQREGREAPRGEPSRERGTQATTSEQRDRIPDVLSSGIRARTVEKNDPSISTPNSYTKSESKRDSGERKGASPVPSKSTSLDQEQQPPRPTVRQDGHVVVLPEQTKPTSQPIVNTNTASISPLAALKRMAGRKPSEDARIYPLSQEQLGGNQNLDSSNAHANRGALTSRGGESPEDVRKAVSSEAPVVVDRPQRPGPSVIQSRAMPAAGNTAVRNSGRDDIVMLPSDSSIRVAPPATLVNLEKVHASRSPLAVVNESQKRSSQESSTPTQDGRDSAHPNSHDQKKDFGVSGLNTATLEQRPVKEVTIRAPPRPQQTAFVTKSTAQDATNPGSGLSTAEWNPATRVPALPDVVQPPWSERYLVSTGPQKPAVTEATTSVPNILQPGRAATDSAYKPFTQPRPAAVDGAVSNGKQPGDGKLNTSRQASGGGVWSADNDESASGTPIASHKRGFWDLFAGPGSSRDKKPELANESTAVSQHQPYQVKPERPAMPASPLDWRGQKVVVSEDERKPMQKPVAPTPQPVGVMQGDKDVPDRALVASPTEISPPVTSIQRDVGLGMISEATQKDFEPMHNPEVGRPSYQRNPPPTTSSISDVSVSSNGVVGNNKKAPDTAGVAGRADMAKPNEAKSRRKSNRMASMYGAQLNFGHDTPMPPMLPGAERAEAPPLQPTDFDMSTFGSKTPATTTLSGRSDSRSAIKTDAPEIRLEDTSLVDSTVRDNSGMPLPQTLTATGQKAGRPPTPKPSKSDQKFLLVPAGTDVVPPIPGIDASEPLRKSQLPAPLSLKSNNAQDASHRPLVSESLAPTGVKDMEQRGSPASSEQGNRDLESQHGVSTSASVEQAKPRELQVAQSSTRLNLQNFRGDIFTVKDSGSTKSASIYDSDEIASFTSRGDGAGKEEAQRHEGRELETTNKLIVDQGPRALSPPVEAAESKSESTLVVAAVEEERRAPSFWSRLNPTTKLHREHLGIGDSQLNSEHPHGSRALPSGVEGKREGSRHLESALESSSINCTHEPSSPLEDQSFEHRKITTGLRYSSELGSESISTLPDADKGEVSFPSKLDEQKASSLASLGMDKVDRTMGKPGVLSVNPAGLGETDYILPEGVLASKSTVPSTSPEQLEPTHKIAMPEVGKATQPSYLAGTDHTMPKQSSALRIPTTPTKMDNGKELEVDATRDGQPSLKSSVAADDLTSTSRSGIATEDQSEDETVASVSIGHVKAGKPHSDSARCSTPDDCESMARQHQSEDERPGSRSSQMHQLNDKLSSIQHELPGSSTVIIGNPLERQSAEQPVASLSGGPEPRPASFISESSHSYPNSTRHVPEIFSTSPAEEESRPSKIHDEDPRPSDETPVFQTKLDDGREAVASRDMLTASGFSSRSPSPSMDSVTLCRHSMDAADQDAPEHTKPTQIDLGLGDKHSSYDTPDHEDILDNGHFQSQEELSAGSHLHVPEPSFTSGGKRGALQAQEARHGAAETHRSSSPSIADSDETRFDLSSRDDVEIASLSDEDTRTEPRRSSPRLSSNREVSTRTSVHSTSAEIAPQSTIKEDEVHEPTYVSRRDSLANSVASGTRSLSKGLPPTSDQDERMAHWLRQVDSPEPEESNRPQSIVVPDNDHHVHSWLHRVSTPVDDSRSRAASPSNFDLESHRAIASESTENVTAMPSHIPPQASDVSSDNRSVAASDLGTADILDRPVASHAETSVQTTPKAADDASIHDDSRRQSITGSEASAPPTSPREKSCLVETEPAVLPADQEDASQVKIHVLDDKDADTEQAPVTASDEIHGLPTPSDPIELVEDHSLDNEDVTEEVPAPHASTSVQHEADPEPHDALTQDGEDHAPEQQTSPDDQPTVEEDKQIDHVVEDEVLEAPREPEKKDNELLPDHVADVDAGESEPTAKESTPDQAIEDSVDPSPSPAMPLLEDEPPVEHDVTDDPKPVEPAAEEDGIPTESIPHQEEEQSAPPVADETCEKLDGIVGDDVKESAPEPDIEEPAAPVSPENDGASNGDHVPAEDFAGEESGPVADPEPEPSCHGESELDGHNPDSGDVLLGPDQEPKLCHEEEHVEPECGDGDREMSYEAQEEEPVPVAKEASEIGDEVDNGNEDHILAGPEEERDASDDVLQDWNEAGPAVHELDEEQMEEEGGFDPEVEAMPSAEEEQEPDGVGAVPTDEEEERDCDGLDGDGHNEDLLGADIESEHDDSPEDVENEEEDLDGEEVGREVNPEAEIGPEEPVEEIDGVEPDGEPDDDGVRDLNDVNDDLEDEILSDGEGLAEEGEREISIHENDHQEEDEISSPADDDSQNGDEDFLDNYDYSDNEDAHEPELEPELAQDLAEETVNQETAEASENGEEEEDREVDMDDLYAVDAPSIPSSPIEVQEEWAAPENAGPVRMSMIYAQSPDLMPLDSPTSPHVPPQEITGENITEEEDDLAPRDPVRFSFIYRQSVDWEQALSSPILRELSSLSPGADEETLPDFPLLDPVTNSEKRTSQRYSQMLEMVPEQMTPVTASPLSPLPPATPPADAAEKSFHHDDLNNNNNNNPPLSSREQPTPPPDPYDAPQQDEQRCGSGGPQTFDEMGLAPRAASPLQPEGDEMGSRSRASSIDLRTFDAHRRTLSRRLSGWWSGGAAAGPSRARTPPPPLPYDNRYGEEPESPS